MTLGRLLRFLLVVCVLASLLACGNDGPPPQTVRREVTAQWQDVFDGTPEIYAVIHPQNLKRDPVYGSFFKTLMRVAQARSDMGGVTALEAAEGCDEVIIGLARKGGASDDAAIVLRGVPANLDPRKMTDAGGHPLFRVLDDRAKVPELEALDRKSVASGSLFVLPDRTWVVAMGPARERARQAFASPFGRPVPKSDPAALASVRIDAAAVIAARMQRSAYVALTKKLASLTLSLQPGKSGALVRLKYEDEDAAAWGEMQTKQVIERLSRAPEPEEAQPPQGPQRPPAAGRRPPPPEPREARLAWLKDAKVSREGNEVRVAMPLPPRLLEELPMASGGDLSL